MKPTAAKLLRRTQTVMLTCHLFVKEQVCKLSLHDIGIPSRGFIFQTHLLDTCCIYLTCSLSLPSFLCRAKRKRHLWNRNRAVYTLLEIHSSWSYRIRWCVNACNKTGNSVMYMCAYLCGLSIGVWGCHIVIFCNGFLSIFFSIEWWRTCPGNKRSNMQMTCDMHST